MFTPAAPPNFYPPALNFTLSATGSEGLGRFPDDLAKVIIRQGALGQVNATWTSHIVTGVCKTGYYYDFNTDPASMCNSAILGKTSGYLPDYPPTPTDIVGVGSVVLCRSSATNNVFYKGKIASGTSAGVGTWVCQLDDFSLPILVGVPNVDVRIVGPAAGTQIAPYCYLNLTPQGDSYCPKQIHIGQQVLLYDSTSTYYERDIVTGVFLSERFAAPTAVPTDAPTTAVRAAPAKGVKAWPTTAAPTAASASGAYSLSVTFQINTPGQMRAAWGSSSTNANDQPPNLKDKVMYPFLFAANHNNTDIGDFVLAEVPGSVNPALYQGCAILSKPNSTFVHCCQVGPQGPFNCIDAPLSGLLTICTANDFPVEPPGFGLQS